MSKQPGDNFFFFNIYDECIILYLEVYHDINCWLLSFRTLPAGYLEIGESAAEGAIRETWEEACAEVEVVSPFAQLDIPLIGQVSEELLFIYIEFLCFFQDFVHLVTKASVFL